MIESPDIALADAASRARLLGLVRRNLRPALLLALAVAVLVFLIRSLGPATYSSSVTLLQAAPQAGLESLVIVTPPAIDPSTYRTIIIDGPLVAQVLAASGMPSGQRDVRDLLERLRITVDSQQLSSVIRLHLSGTDPAETARTVNLLAQAVVSWDRDRGTSGLEAGLNALQESVTLLERQLQSQQQAGQDTTFTTDLLQRQRAELQGARTRLDSLVVTPLLEVLRFAEAADQPDSKRGLLFATVAFVIAFVIALAGLLVMSILNQRVRSEDDVADATNLTVLARLGPLVPIEAEQDAADLVREALLAGTDRRQPLVVLVAGADESASSFRTSVALADSFGRAGRRTLLIDADLRNPASGSSFGLKSGHFATLEQYLLNPEKRLELVSVRQDGARLFSLLPTFNPGDRPGDLLRANLGGLIKAWKQRFSVIIVNSAALPRYPDTAGIARHADKSLLVVRLGGTDTTQLERAAGTLKSLGTTAPAVVTVGARSLPAYGERYELSVLQATTRPTSTGE